MLTLLQHFRRVFLYHCKKRGKRLNNSGYTLEVWKLKANIEIQVTQLRNGSQQQTYVSVYENNCLIFFPIKSPKSELA